jgi:hypothetical protein
MATRIEVHFHADDRPTVPDDARAVAAMGADGACPARCPHLPFDAQSV